MGESCHRSLADSSIRLVNLALHDKLRFVMTVPVQIRREDVVEDIRKLSEATGKPITEAVGGAVRAALAAIEADRASRLAAARETIARFNALPDVGTRLTDADLYDEDGLPK